MNKEQFSIHMHELVDIAILKQKMNQDFLTIFTEAYLDWKRTQNSSILSWKENKIVFVRKPVKSTYDSIDEVKCLIEYSKTEHSIIDLRHVDYLNTDWIRILIRCKGNGAKIINVSEKIVEIADYIGFEKCF